MASTSTGPETKVEIRRMFAATREKVFEAWTQRDKVEKWMCRFPNNETRYTAFDARPGGTNITEVISQDGTTYKQRVTFREIRSPEKLVFTWTWEKFSPSGQKISEQDETLVTVEFQARGNFTEVFLTHEGFTNAEARADHNKGWNGAFDALEKALEA
jgi:uncharacterized protein YndB with AHSA1/START domain